MPRTACADGRAAIACEGRRSTRPAPVGRRGVRRVAAVLLLVLAHAAAAADLDAQTLMQRMSAAVRELDYQGSFVYEHDGRVDAMRLFHQGGAEGRERLLSLNGPRSEVLREGRTITCVQGDRPATLLPSRSGGHLLPLVPDTNGIRAARLYAVSLGGEDRVAGYRARVVEMRPLDAYRYGYRVWLDEATQMLLRSAVVDHADRTLEQFMFISLEIGAKPKESDLALSGGAAATALPPEEAPLQGAPQWRVADPPPGFVLVRSQRPALGPSQVEHQVWSDGIASISVYVEPRDAGAAGAADSAASRGAVNVYARSDGAWKITALGDVPRAAVERMARSIAAAGG